MKDKEKEKEEKAAEAPADAKPDTADELEVGDVLPDLTLKNEKGDDIKIAEIAKEKGVVFFLVPKADTRKSSSRFRVVFLSDSRYSSIQLAAQLKHVASVIATKSSRSSDMWFTP